MWEYTIRLDRGEMVTGRIQSRRFEPGDRVEVYETLIGMPPNEETVYYPTDRLRRAPLAWLTVLFVAVAAVVGRAKGLRAVIGLAFSLAVILLAMVPAINNGINPPLVAILGSSVILAVSVYFVHGVNWTTSAALIGTIGAAAVAMGLSVTFTRLAHLSGFGTEEAMFIQQLGGNVNLQGLLIAGMLVGALGALVDSSIAQAAVVRELAGLAPGLSWRRLYAGAMNVGFDHIGSLINTLVLAYAGSALPLFVLFNLSGADVMRVLNGELIAAEVVQSLVGSIALILAVPLSSLVAALLFAGNTRPGGSGVHSHAELYRGAAEAADLEKTLRLPVRKRSRLLERDGGEPPEGA